MKKRAQKRPSGMISSTSTSNISLHSNYLGFAVQAAEVKPYAKRPFGVPVSRSIVDAIRYSFDSIDASAEYAYQLMKGGPDGDTRPDNWLRRYIDREWKNLPVSDKLGLLSFFHRGGGFWVSDAERVLFEDLKHVRNALTHPGLFGKTVEAEYPDFHAEPVWSETTIKGKLKRGGVSHAGFAEHPEDLSVEDAKKAVEIALRHAERFEQLLGAKDGSILFGAISSKTGDKRAAARILSKKKKRYFDEIWGVKEKATTPSRA
jgi:hypothetical protein